MDGQLKKALLICLFFLLVFALVPIEWHKVGDFNFHFQKASGDCKENSCFIYYPLFHRLASVFSFNERAFTHFVLFLLIIVTPMLLFFIERNWMVVWLYFSATQYLYLIEGGAAYPQALAIIFLLLFLAIKSIPIRIIILAVAILSHSQAFMLLTLIWFVTLLFENLPKAKNFFPACSALFGRQEIDPLGHRVQVELINISGNTVPIHVLLKDILNFFARVFPLPFLIMAFWQLKKEKNWAFFAIIALIFYYGIVTQQSRIFVVIPIILLPVLTRFYSKLERKWKKWFIILTIITFLANFGLWGLYKLQCL